MAGFSDDELSQRLNEKDWFVQAQRAAHHQDWYQVTQSLHYALAAPSSLDSQEVTHSVTLALQVLHHGDFHDRWQISQVFARLGAIAPAQISQIIQPLVAALSIPDDEDDDELSWFATRILGNLQHPDVLAALIDLLKTTDRDDLSQLAAEALAGFGAVAIAALREVLAIPAKRLLIVKTLGQIRSPDIIEPVLSVVTDANPLVRMAAIEALGGFRDRAITSVLVQALRDASSGVRQAAVTELGFRVDLLAELDLVLLIRPLLHDPSVSVCRQAAIALGRLGSEGAITTLVQVLQSSLTPASLQIEIIRTLGWVATPTALASLEAMIRTQRSVTPDVMRELIAALGRTQSISLRQQAAHCLVRLLQSDHPTARLMTIRQTIAQELGQLGDPNAIEPLLSLTAETDMGVKLHAIAALKKLDATTAHTRMQALVDDPATPDPLRHEMAIALQEW